jgi:tetratricopeptide (TPR) repeat protein
MRRDTRLRWASLLVVRWDEVWSEQSPVPAVERILGTLSALAEPERALKERAESRIAFDTRMEITGPARLLRALAASGKPLRVTIQNPRLLARIDLSEGLVVGATAENTGPGEHDLSGPAALAALLLISSGRVHVDPTEQPATTNMMATPDVALSLADAEPPPIPPSIPAGRRESQRPAAGVRPRSVPPPKKRPTSPVGVIVYALGGLFAVLAIGGFVLLLMTHALRPRTAPAPLATAPEPAPCAVASQASAPHASERPKPTAARAPTALPEPVSAAESDALSEAPSCAKLLGPLPPATGVYPGAAYDAVRAARKALLRGDMDAAQASYCQAVRYDPKNAEARAGLARMLLSRRDARAAIESAREAVRLAPEEKGFQLLLGDALALGGEASKSVEPILLGSGLSAGDDAGRAKLVSRQIEIGQDAAKKQDHVGAERAYRRAFVLDPRNAAAATGLARALLELGHPKAAIFWATRAVSLDPKSATAQLVLGDSLAKSGDESAASKAWKTAVELDPNDAAARARAMTAE